MRSTKNKVVSYKFTSREIRITDKNDVSKVSRFYGMSPTTYVVNNPPVASKNRLNALEICRT